MKKFPLLFAISLLSIFTITSQAEPPTANPAADPQPRDAQWCLDSHERLNQKALNNAFDVILIGDSITWEWEANKDTGLKVWPQLKEFNPGTFAISGDRTEHVLWRLLNGNLNLPTAPKVAVLMIGTNNTGQRQDSPEQIAGGTKAILDEISKRFPDIEILLYGIFPRGASPKNATRKNNDAANQLVSQFADGEKIHYININKEFLHPDGTLNDACFRDGVHLSEAGYQVWADSLKTEIPKVGAL